MPSKDRLKVKGRKISGGFVAFPHDCLNHVNFIILSPYAVKLLVDLYSQYRGKNNGDLCMTWSMMKNRGWRSEATLNKARHELIHYGWITLTRQGGRNAASLYAVTWQSIDECKGKLDARATNVASGAWKEPKMPFLKTKKSKRVLRDPYQPTTPKVVKIGVIP
ncbi:MAG: hypothetical protein AB8B89_04610 [Gammaproteobacteria bacterium]